MSSFELCTMAEKILVGNVIKKVTVESDPRETPKLFQEFMPKLARIEGKTDANIYLLKTNASFLVENSSPAYYDKWACVAVKNLEDTSSELLNLDAYTLKQGLYISVQCEGLAEYFDVLTQKLPNWLMENLYIVDSGRPQFEILPKGYHITQNPLETIYIPIKEK